MQSLDIRDVLKEIENTNVAVQRNMDYLHAEEMSAKIANKAKKIPSTFETH